MNYAELHEAVDKANQEVTRLLSLVPNKHPSQCNKDELAAYDALSDALQRSREAVSKLRKAEQKLDAKR